MDPSSVDWWLSCYHIRCWHVCSNLLERRGQRFQPSPNTPIALLPSTWYGLVSLLAKTNQPWHSIIIAQTHHLSPFKQISSQSSSFSWRIDLAFQILGSAPSRGAGWWFNRFLASSDRLVKLLRAWKRLFSQLLPPPTHAQLLCTFSDRVLQLSSFWALSSNNQHLGRSTGTDQSRLG